ncbi:hypothetical protein HBJ16_005215, partial [Pseudomonas sp. CES]
ADDAGGGGRGYVVLGAGERRYPRHESNQSDHLITT